MSKEVIISNSSLNSYGFRVLTAGVDIKQYKRNPILLWMHMRPYRGTKDEVLPLGRVENIRIDGDELIGTPVFDATDDFTREVQAKWEANTLRAVSAGFEPVEWSEDKKYMLPGQQFATLTKSKLIEVSICDIGANDDALKLYNQGKMVELSRNGELPIPKITNHNTTEKMQKIALTLGLSEQAAENEILSKINSLQKEADKVVSLTQELNDVKTQLEGIKKSELISLIDAAITAGKITPQNRDHFVGLADKLGKEELKKTLECLSAPARPSGIIDPEGGTATYKKLSDVPPAEVARLRKEQREEYVRLYKAEYGINPKIEE